METVEAITGPCQRHIKAIVLYESPAQPSQDQKQKAV